MLKTTVSLDPCETYKPCNVVCKKKAAEVEPGREMAACARRITPYTTARHHLPSQLESQNA